MNASSIANRAANDVVEAIEREVGSDFTDSQWQGAVDDLASEIAPIVKRIISAARAAEVVPDA